VRQTEAALQAALSNRRLVQVRQADVDVARDSLHEAEANYTTILAQRMQVGQKHSGTSPRWPTSRGRRPAWKTPRRTCSTATSAPRATAW